jgi:hypothetical protein
MSSSTTLNTMRNTFNKFRPPSPANSMQSIGSAASAKANYTAKIVIIAVIAAVFVIALVFRLKTLVITPALTRAMHPTGGINDTPPQIQSYAFAAEFIQLLFILLALGIAFAFIQHSLPNDRPSVMDALRNAMMPRFVTTTSI